MVKKQDETTESTILAAARVVFHKHGMAGARMQQIADEAGINKALLHYYFRSKEKLFKAVFLEGFKTIVPRMNSIFDSDMPLFSKIETFAEQYISFILQNPFLPAFVIQEMNNNPHFAKEYLSSLSKPNPRQFMQQIKKEVDAGNIRPVDPLQLILNIFSLCLFPFMAGTMIQEVTGMNKKQYQQILTQRKKEVAQFIINAIKL